MYPLVSDEQNYDAGERLTDKEFKRKIYRLATIKATIKAKRLRRIRAIRGANRYRALTKHSIR